MSGDEPKRRRRWGWLRWPLALGLIAWLILPNLDGLRELVGAGVLWRWLLAAAGLRLFALTLAGVRWNLLLTGQQTEVPVLQVFRLQCVGYVCNFLFPGTWGGDVARAGLIAADTPEHRMRGAATVPLDRGIGLLAFILIGAIAGLVRWASIPAGLPRLAVIGLVVLAVLGVVFLCALVLAPMPRRRRKSTATIARTKGDPQNGSREESVEIEDAPTRRQRLGRELLLGLSLLRESRASVAVAFLLATVGHGCLCLSLYCCLPAYPAATVPVTATDHLWLVPAAEVPAAFLPVPGGVGAREGTLSLLYGSLTGDEALSRRYARIGVIVAATFSSVCLVLAAIIGIVLALGGFRPTSQADDSAVAQLTSSN